MDQIHQPPEIALSIRLQEMGIVIPGDMLDAVQEEIRKVFTAATAGQLSLMRDRLTVKELAVRLEVSPNYVYQMRKCGFLMNGTKRSNQTTTYIEAIGWIRQNNFRMKDGLGQVLKSVKRKS